VIFCRCKLFRTASSFGASISPFWVLLALFFPYHTKAGMTYPPFNFDNNKKQVCCRKKVLTIYNRQLNLPD